MSKLLVITTGKNGKLIKRLDVEGKWPTGTWLQKRGALLKLEESKKILSNGRE